MVLHKQRATPIIHRFNFGADCVEVIFNFCPTWAEVGFWNSDQLGWKSIFYSRQVVGKLVLKILSNLGRIIFWIFLETLLKMPFSAATTGRDFFCGHSPKRQFHRLPLREAFWKIADEARIKSLVFPATIWERLWTKCCSHRLPLERKFFCARYESECFFWRYMKIVFQNPLINRS